MIMRTASPVTAGGVPPRTIERRRRTEPPAMDRQDAARAEELNNLRLALATFALQLDAFELRMSDGLLGGGAKPKTLACGRAPLQPSEGRNDCSSINSHGGRSEG
jgi:hypothetical protein